MNPARRSRNHFRVRGLVRAFGRRLVAVQCGKASNSPGPLDAAPLWRKVAKAAKAVTSHRTPNACRLCAKFHHCSTDKKSWRRLAGSAIGGDTFSTTICVHLCPSVVSMLCFTRGKWMREHGLTLPMKKARRSDEPHRAREFQCSALADGRRARRKEVRAARHTRRWAWRAERRVAHSLDLLADGQDHVFRGGADELGWGEVNGWRRFEHIRSRCACGWGMDEDERAVQQHPCGIRTGAALGATNTG